MSRLQSFNLNFDFLLKLNKKDKKTNNYLLILVNICYLFINILLFLLFTHEEITFFGKEIILLIIIIEYGKLIELCFWDSIENNLI
jgi:hypothetical protein